jgi:parallel beta-helix repeat protein
MSRMVRSGVYGLFACIALLAALPASADPVLSVSTSSVVVQGNVGSNAPSTTIQVINSGNGALKWSVSGAFPSWLSVSPTSGVNTKPLTLTFRTSGLGEGQYQTSFTVTAGASSAIVSVVVNMVTPVAAVAPPIATLAIACPANTQVTSLDGSPVVVNYTATTSGGVAPVSITGSPASGTAFPVGVTTVNVTAQSSDGQSARCSFSVTVNYTSGSSAWTFCANEGGVCAFTGTMDVRYGANGVYTVKTLTDGTPCTNSVFGDPIPGTVKQCATGAASSPPPPGPAPTSTSAYGPQATITCPAGAIDIWPGQYIQGAVNSYPGATTFCLRAGVHSVTSSIKPKTGNTFVGEYGAILDGSGYWPINDGTQAAFRAHNEDIDYVTIRNLVIKNMPQQGIHAYYWMSDHWTIEYNEIASNTWGLEFGANFTIRNNYIHHNVGNTASSNPAERGGGYVGDHADNTTFDSNEIAYNGREQKVGRSANVTFRNNFVHHNIGDGIWYDTNPNAGALIDGNRVEDNGRNGIFFEASVGATISNNTLRRNPWDAVIISMSQNAQIYNNTLEGNFGGIEYFLNCDVLSGGDDVKNNAAYGNTVVVGTQSYAYGSSFSALSSCTSTQVAPYLNGSKNLTFSRNSYRVPSLSSTRYFIWGGVKSWTEWQALGQDVGGSLTQ